MKHFHSYKQQPEIAESYDAIFIGSGLGSLTTAVLLAEKGWKVLVLEKHYTPGGFTHVFKRNDYEWDVGIHYIGDVTRPNSMIFKVFEHVTDGKLQWADMGEVYDTIVIKDRYYPFRKGVKNFVEDLKARFPSAKDHEAIDTYIDLLFSFAKTGATYYAEKVVPGIIGKVTGPFMRRGFMKLASRTTLNVLSEITDNKELIAVLTGQYGDFGMPPAVSSFAIHATVAKHYLNGGAYPVGGSSSIFEYMAPKITAAGGTVLISAAVDHIMEDKFGVTGVKMADGREIKSRTVISGAGVHNTFLRLINDDSKNKIPFLQDLKTLPASYGHMSLYMGFQHSVEELNLPKANYWYYPQGNDHDAAVQHFLKDPVNNEFPVVYMSFPAAKDPSWQERYPGKSTVELITMIPTDIFRKWEGTRWKKRGEDYDALKEKLSQRLMEALFKLEPQLRGKVDCYELSTPLTTQHFANYINGEIYGLDHGPERFKKKYLKPTTPIKGLYLTGQDIVTVGIGGALMSGVLTASAILKTNLLRTLLQTDSTAKPQ